MQQAAPHFVLYSRSWCHLCEDMLAALRNHMARAGLPYTLDVVDVDADPALAARFDELVPVLFAGGQQLCHYVLDEAVLQHWLQAWLARSGARPRDTAGAG
jgi:thioredoxin-like negative regulator of GroEL